MGRLLKVDYLMRFQWCSSVYFPYCLPSNQVYIPPTPYHCITCHLPGLAAKALIWKRHRFDLKCQTNFTHSLPQNANEIRKCLFFAIKHATSFLSEKLTVFWTFCKKCSKNFKGRVLTTFHGILKYDILLCRKFQQQSQNEGFLYKVFLQITSHKLTFEECTVWVMHFEPRRKRCSIYTTLSNMRVLLGLLGQRAKLYKLIWNAGLTYIFPWTPTTNQSLKVWTSKHLSRNSGAESWSSHTTQEAKFYHVIHFFSFW